MDATAQQNGITHDVDDGVFTIEGEAAPEIEVYTISNYTIVPPQKTWIDVRFSEYVEAWISIEDMSRNAVNELYHSPNVKNPDPKSWNGTYEDGTQVPDGNYYVNVTGLNTTTGLSVVNNTEIITVASAPYYDVDLTVDDETKSTIPNVNVTYALTVKNTGTIADDYTLIVDNADGADVAAPDTYTITNLAPGATQDVVLNVADATTGAFRVNVTVVSDNDPTNATDYVNTTTTVEEVRYDVKLTVDKTAQTVYTSKTANIYLYSQKHWKRG